MKKDKQTCHRAKHNRNPLQSNLGKRAWACRKGLVSIVLLEMCCTNHLVCSCLTYLCVKTDFSLLTYCSAIAEKKN